ncbi:MAG: hypothetical protein HKP36_04920 [Myxococcales bacterium]|nr:hypothetical protein [Deltaproteobacteria bacterium]NNL23776.1 hypothetical protein [Myxococcales bacterium]
MPKRPLALLFSVLLAGSGTTGVVLHVCQSMGGGALGDCDCEREWEHAGHGDHTAHMHHAPGPKLDQQPCCSVELTDADPVLATHKASTLRVDNASAAIVGLGFSSVPTSRLGCDPGLLREGHLPTLTGRRSSFATAPS